MINTNFKNIATFRGILAEHRGNLSSLISTLRNRDQVASSLPKGFKEFPFALTQDQESQLPEIHSTHYMRYIIGQENIAISYTDALWLMRVGVPMKSPYSHGVEAFTMSIAFGVLLPIFKENFTKDPAQVFSALLFTCLILYPVTYELSRRAYTWKNPGQRNFPYYSLQDLIHEGFKLFAILSTTLVGMDLFDLPLLQASVAAGIAPTLQTLLDTLTRSPEISWTVVWETIRAVFTGAAVFTPLIYILNSMPTWLPAVTRYSLLINPAFIFMGIMSYGKIMRFLSQWISAYFYHFPSETLINIHHDQALPRHLPGASIIAPSAVRGARDRNTVWQANTDNSEDDSLLVLGSSEA